ncbi:hypothetical protein BN133_2036 [Cronobacter dublinensis 582]|uniref:AAA family ATPase n=1 Tax=Cronobacter dublinensis TaxID=413497 RepID=UPI00029C1372|nr:AAA family ATPase [Cronobacter dublinensis]MDI6439153.1 AAA family ATPase [Cronobacter dublinensis]CCJ85659.1 hypothetical protein BN133_2036 [Cronobacter dublinensis 582]
MITGISNIKGLGVYNNYSKPAGIQEFSVKNLIYGWNYSGKTTLSRLFAQLESKRENPDLKGCSFTLETDAGVITEKDFIHSTVNVRVFNSDFIRDNLNFSGESFHPILLLGKDTQIAQQKIDRLESRIKLANEKITAITKIIDEHKTKFSQAKTQLASHIRKTLNITDPYNATHLVKDMDAINRLGNSHLLLEENYRNDLKLALTSDSETLPSLATITVSPSLALLHTEAGGVLSTIPSFSNTIKLLEEDHCLEKWIEEGLALHSEKVVCEFCGGNLDHDRMQRMLSHFSKDLLEHKEKVKKLHARINLAKINVSFPTESDFHHQFRDSFRNAIQKCKEQVENFNAAVVVLEREVQQKINEIFKSHHVTPLPENITSEFIASIESINEVIRNHNDLTSNFKNQKTECAKRVRFHLVQGLVDEHTACRRDHKIRVLEGRKEKLDKYIKNTEEDIQKQLAIISLAQLGREEINKRLLLTLGSEAVQIKVVNVNGQDRFKLVRKNGLPAKNLSDGEKTAIAFNYFLIKLKELSEDIFSETIVYIDDPISSLDSNHIFQVNAAIREFFFHQNSKGSWTTKCKQVFISTHNFEFFNLLRELKPASKDAQRLYLIKRVDEQSTSFVSMPESLTKYSSEYHYLFDVIYAFLNAPTKTEHHVLILLPNAIRRFVELYTYSRLPGTSGETVDQRAEILFGEEKAKRILKVLHFFSHGNSIERLARNNELIFDVEAAVKDLFDTISNKDPLHWGALLKAVS